MRELLVNPELPGYAPEIGAAMWRLEDTRHRTLALLEDMPEAVSYTHLTLPTSDLV